MEHIKHLFKEKEHCQTIKTSVEEFKCIKPFLEEERLKYTFDARSCLLDVTMATPMHSSGAVWLSEWVGKIQNSGETAVGSLDCVIEGSLGNFEDDFAGSRKTPDASIFPGIKRRKKPTICLEVGYTESYEKLLRDADLLLEGSTGKIGRVILVNIEPLTKGETEIKEGFVEVWKYDTLTGHKMIVGDRKDLCPRPSNGAMQQLVFSWEDILGDKMQECRTGTARSPPTLKIDLLRAHIKKATEWYLEEKQEEEGQNEYVESVLALFKAPKLMCLPAQTRKNEANT
ncbi:hypothetical protein V8E54_010474 [Elaphomyces granulatus]